MNGVSLQAAFVLHHRAFRNTSIIANLITPDFGRVDVIAQGARSPKSRKRPLLQPFRPLLASWSGRSNLKTLTGLEEKGLSLPLDDEALGCAYYVTELVLRLIPHDEANARAFAAYTDTLSRLSVGVCKSTSDSSDRSFEPILRLFEIELLDSQGVLPDFAECDVSGEPVSSFRTYQFDCLAGVATQLESASETAVRVSGATLVALANKEFIHEQVLAESKRLMRRVLRIHLGDKPLNSRLVYAQFRSGNA